MIFDTFYGIINNIAENAGFSPCRLLREGVSARTVRKMGPTCGKANDQGQGGNRCPIIVWRGLREVPDDRQGITAFEPR